MKSRINSIKGLVNEDSQRVFLYTFLCGIFAHGVGLFNKFGWHSELAHAFELNTYKAISLGRWLRAILAYLVKRAFGGYNLSLPLFHGIASLVCIAAASYAIVHAFGIKEKLLQFIVSAMLAVFPVVTSTFMYMYTAPYYFLAMFLAAAAVCAAAEKPGIPGFLAGSVCVCCSLGIYQVYFPVTVSLFVILLIFRIARGDIATIPAIFKTGLYYLGVCIAGLAEYFIVTKVGMAVLHVTPDSYQGINSIGTSGIGAYLQGILTTYKRFFFRFDVVKENLYPIGLGVVQKALIGAGILLALCLVVRQFKKSVLTGLALALLIALLPLCFNLIYVMIASSPDSYIHSLMLYGQVMLYVALVCGIKLILSEKGKLIAALRGFILGALVLMVAMNTYFDNACYLKAEMDQQRTISQLTALVANIKSTPGYNDKLPVCIVMTGKRDATFPANEAFSDIEISPFKYIYPHHNSRNLKNFLNYWCGFAPTIVPSKQFQDREEVINMPDYPDDGGIQIIDDTVVVKW